MIGDVFEDNILMSFQQLQHKFNLRKHHFCGYLQFSHFMSSIVKPAEDTSLYSGAEKFIHEQMDLNMVISLFCSVLYSYINMTQPNSHENRRAISVINTGLAGSGTYGA